MKKLPFILVWSRLLTGLATVIVALRFSNVYPAFAATAIIYGLVSDVLDGIIARQQGVSTEKLRRLDSGIDQVFWLSIIASAFIQHPSFFHKNIWYIVVLMSVEALTYVISYARFRKEVATHAITSKLWALTLFATLLQLVQTGDASFWFTLCFYIGIVTRAEIVAILLLLRKWTNDVPSVYHAILIRQGKPIRRHNLFNG
jgi:phosphatidylglycerophosphate synthase